MILRNEATGEVITKPCVPNWKWNTGTDENPLDSFGRPFHRLPSMAEYQMAKKSGNFRYNQSDKKEL